MFIFYTTNPYARRIARELKVTSVFPSKKFTSRRRNGMSHCVNWGCGRRLLGTVSFGNRPMLNADIKGSARKMRTFELLRAAHLPIPRIVIDPKEIIDGFPFYTRGKYLGRLDGLSGGEGITVYDKDTLPEAGAKHDFYSQVIAKAYEVRIHVTKQNGVICEQFKYVPLGSNVLIRNFANGAKFSARALHTRMSQKDADEARRLAIASLNACNLDFAAFDMALSKSGNWVIFEANSAPGMTERDDDMDDVGDANDMLCSYDAYREYFRQFIIR